MNVSVIFLRLALVDPLHLRIFFSVLVNFETQLRWDTTLRFSTCILNEEKDIEMLPGVEYVWYKNTNNDSFEILSSMRGFPNGSPRHRPTGGPLRPSVWTNLLTFLVGNEKDSGMTWFDANIDLDPSLFFFSSYLIRMDSSSPKKAPALLCVNWFFLLI